MRNTTKMVKIIVRENRVKQSKNSRLILLIENRRTPSSNQSLLKREEIRYFLYKKVYILEWIYVFIYLRGYSV